MRGGEGVIEAPVRWIVPTIAHSSVWHRVVRHSVFYTGASLDMVAW